MLYTILKLSIIFSSRRSQYSMALKFAIAVEGPCILKLLFWVIYNDLFPVKNTLNSFSFWVNSLESVIFSRFFSFPLKFILLHWPFKFKLPRFKHCRLALSHIVNHCSVVVGSIRQNVMAWSICPAISEFSDEHRPVFIHHFSIINRSSYLLLPRRLLDRINP